MLYLNIPSRNTRSLWSQQNSNLSPLKAGAHIWCFPSNSYPQLRLSQVVLGSKISITKHYSEDSSAQISTKSIKRPLEIQHTHTKNGALQTRKFWVSISKVQESRYRCNFQWEKYRVRWFPLGRSRTPAIRDGFLDGSFEGSLVGDLQSLKFPNLW